MVGVIANVQPSEMGTADAEAALTGTVGFTCINSHIPGKSHKGWVLLQCLFNRVLNIIWLDWEHAAMECPIQSLNPDPPTLQPLSSTTMLHT